MSLSAEDVALLDEYAVALGLKSRSAVVQRAIRSLAQSGLEQDYAEAWDEWNASREGPLWEKTAHDGLR